MFTAKSIRTIIDLLESVGLANRRPGEVFANPAGDKWIFQSLDFYPESGEYNPEELNQALQQTGVDINSIQWVNKQTAKHHAFGIAKFKNDDGTMVNIGRWYYQINPNRSKNSWPNDELPGNFSYQSRTAKKEKSEMQPSQILTQYQENTPSSIAAQVSTKFGKNSDQFRAIQSFMSQDLPALVPAGQMDQSASQDYFCELLGPIALIQGKKVKGNALEAAGIFFGPNQNFSDCTISFNSNSIGGLYDSLLINSDGRQIKLSSKGKEGATASVTNLLRSLDELSQAPQGKKLLKKYNNAVEIIRTIQREGQYQAPLTLAAQFGIIDQKDVTKVNKLRDLKPTANIDQYLSPKLKKFYMGRKARDERKKIPFYHMLASIAYAVADYVNTKTNFGEAASAILNNAALVQLYTTVKSQGDNFEITMDAKYPSEAVTGVLLDPQKVYYSSDVKGHFTFKILKNGASANDINPGDPVEEPIDASTDVSNPVDLDQEVERQRLTGPGVRAAKLAQRRDNDSEKTLGRTKRKR